MEKPISHEELTKLMDSFEDGKADEQLEKAMAERLETDQIITLLRHMAQRVRANEERLTDSREYSGPHPFRTIEPPTLEQILRIRGISRLNAVSTDTSAPVGGRRGGGAAARVRRIRPDERQHYEP